jgi:hypothetical protein
MAGNLDHGQHRQARDIVADQSIMRLTVARRL